MKILYIVQHFMGMAGHSGLRPFENTRRLVRMGHEVTLLCGMTDLSKPEDVIAAREEGITILQAPIHYSQRLSYFKRMVSFRRFMKWAVRTGKELSPPDIVFASSTPLSVGEIGRQVAAHHGVPFVFEVRDLWPEVPVAMGALNNPVLRLMAYRMARRVYRAADHVVALSSGMKEVIVQAWGVAESRVSVIPNCSDTQLFRVTDTDVRARERSRHGWEDKFLCIHSGSMGLANGLDYLLDCAKFLDEHDNRDIHIALVGDGAQRDHLAKRIANEHIRSASIYPPVAKREIPNLLTAADVGVVSFLPNPIFNTNSANKFFDFLAAGLPIIVNYAGWQADVLRDSGAGDPVDPHDPTSLAYALLALHANPAQCQTMRAAARYLAETRYDRELLVTQLEQLLCRVVKELSCTS